MVQVAPITEAITTIQQAEDRLQLKPARDNHFFSEWFEDLPELTSLEIASLERIKTRYHYHRKHGPLAEGTVNFIVLAPLLELAGFYDPPFLIRSEATVEIQIESRSMTRFSGDALIPWSSKSNFGSWLLNQNELASA
jgi:hypothetical protein